MKECGTILWWQAKQWYTLIWKTALNLACFPLKGDVSGSSKAAIHILHSGSLRMKNFIQGASMYPEPLASHLFISTGHKLPSGSLRAKGYEI